MKNTKKSESRDLVKTPLRPQITFDHWTGPQWEEFCGNIWFVLEIAGDEILSRIDEEEKQGGRKYVRIYQSALTALDRFEKAIERTCGDEITRVVEKMDEASEQACRERRRKKLKRIDREIQS